MQIEQAIEQAAAWIVKTEPYETATIRELAQHVNSGEEGWTLSETLPDGWVRTSRLVFFTPEELERVIALAENWDAHVQEQA